jgi:transcriptional regulator with XRE-family HTH domain
MDSNLVAKFSQMEQPELGKLIADLRKKKGLTQEELVELCNINVRTIQRIEAGEVNPRSYTIKNILEALEAEEELLNKETNNNNSSADNREQIDNIQAQNQELNIGKVKAGIACGIINIVLLLPLMIVGLWAAFDDKNFVSWVFYAILMTASFFMFFHFLSGVAQLATTLGKFGLAAVFKRVRYLWIVVAVLDILLFAVPDVDSVGFWVFFAFYLAAYISISTYLYYNMYEQGKDISDEMRNAGISGLIACAMMLTVLLSPFAFIPIIVTHVMLLITLNRAVKVAASSQPGASRMAT